MKGACYMKAAEEVRCEFKSTTGKDTSELRVIGNKATNFIFIEKIQ